MKKYLLFILTSFACVQTMSHPLDEVFSKSQQARSNTDSSVSSSIQTDMDKAQDSLGAKVREGDRKREERNEYSRNNPPANKQESTSKTKSSSDYTCTFHCKTQNIVSPNDRVNGLSVIVAASSESEAKNAALSKAKDICWSKFKMQVSSEWFVGSASCRK
jgi:hypothetical protein